MQINGKVIRYYFNIKLDLENAEDCGGLHQTPINIITDTVIPDIYDTVFIDYNNATKVHIEKGYTN
jgi:hypothetical protein